MHLVRSRKCKVKQVVRDIGRMPYGILDLFSPTQYVSSIHGNKLVRRFVSMFRSIFDAEPWVKIALPLMPFIACRTLAEVPI